MNDEDNYLPISLITHTSFCERRTWLEANGEKTDTAQMQTGFSAHQPADDPSRSRSHVLTAHPLRSDALGLIGRADLLEFDENDQVTIVDYEATPVRLRAVVTPAQKLQLTLQRICLEEQGFDVAGQEIYFVDHRTRVPVELGENDQRFAIETINQTKSIVESTTAPPPLSADERCGGCSHFSVCMPDEHFPKSPSRRIHASDPDGQVLHLTVQGSRASIRKGRVLVTKSGQELGSVPLERIQAVVVHGNIDISSALNRNLLWKNIRIVWCSSTGRVYGYSTPTDGPNGLTRVEQHVSSQKGRLDIASAMVSAKINNQATLLRRSTHSRSTAFETLRKLAKHALEASDLPSLFGIEGEAASFYFGSFSEMLNEERLSQLDWSWQGRQGRNAIDPLNVLLNYCYGLLRSETIRAILQCGLDPHAGFLHSSTRNKPALALDLMEEFRAPVADSVVVSMVNRREIKKSVFTRVGGTMRLRDTGRKKVIAAFERRAQTKFHHPVFKYEVTWRRAIEVQARIVLGVLDGSIDHYTGVRIR